MAEQHPGEHPVIIVGAGLSGLYAAALLKANGVAPLILEARDRAGGRILSLETDGEAYELGPSWVWPGQPRIAALLTELGISSFSQYSHGALLYQQADGRLDRHDGLAPMANALRITGGPSALITALANQVGAQSILLNHEVTDLAHDGQSIALTANSPNGPKTFTTHQLALAMPPRLGAGLDISPALSDPFQGLLNALPTWMAGHAKFTAVYRQAFWRNAGLSGDAMSRRGPLVEIHDISPKASGPYALFGFVGLDANARQQISPVELKAACTAQLADIFGADAAEPIRAELQDWSLEAFTAAPADQAPLRHHPAYGLSDTPSAPWTDSLHFISSETAHENGGLIEGALQSGHSFAAKIIERGNSLQDDAGKPRTAKMSWDWL